jgi:chemotaxis protein MotA
MLVIFGLVFVIACVLGGYMAMGGKLGVLNQPFEVVIIGGAGVGAMIAGNPKHVLGPILKSFGRTIKGAKYSKDDYLELLTMLYSVFKLAKSKGDLALESHVEKPEDSPMFQKFPKFMGDHHTVESFCDYLRLLTLGTSTAHEVEAVIDAELEAHHDADHDVSSGMTNFAESFPALGIVAAVLGVIKTMGSITEPPEVLGALIGGALVGTFLGILLCYGIFGPMGRNLELVMKADSHYPNVIKAGLMAHMQGYAPQVSVEFARKNIPHTWQPSFAETEEAIQNLPPD